MIPNDNVNELILCLNPIMTVLPKMHQVIATNV